MNISAPDFDLPLKNRLTLLYSSAFGYDVAQIRQWGAFTVCEVFSKKKYDNVLS
jgi:hypothetical protein